MLKSEPNLLRYAIYGAEEMLKKVESIEHEEMLKPISEENREELRKCHQIIPRLRKSLLELHYLGVTNNKYNQDWYEITDFLQKHSKES